MSLKAAIAENTRNNKLEQLMERTGYPIMQMNGQRIFGPPTDWDGISPPKDSEIFIGRIPRQIFEDELVPIFSLVGRIYCMRLMMDFSGMNRGYAFVTYTVPAHANAAVMYLNNYEIRPNRHIGVYKSIDNCRLFVGALPQDKTQQQVWDALEMYVEGIVDVIMYPGNNVNEDGHRNRGYVFLEFDCHRSAALARRMLGSGVRLWDTPIAVDWADPIPVVEPAIMMKVTKLYIRNVNTNMSNAELMLHLGKYVSLGMIAKVHKILDYAFVHFHSRSDAEKALRALQGAVIKGKAIEVSWARPRIYSKQYRMNVPAENFCTSVPPRMRRLVQMRKPLPARAVPGSSSQYSSGRSSQSVSPQMNVYGNLSVNVADPQVNVFNFNVGSTRVGNVVPFASSTFKL